jgi:hypothetical protein
MSFPLSISIYQLKDGRQKKHDLKKTIPGNFDL